MNKKIFFILFIFCVLSTAIKSHMVFSLNTSINKTNTSLINLNKTLKSISTNQKIKKNEENNSINLSFEYFSCIFCKNKEKLKYKICLSIKNSSKTETYLVNYSIKDLKGVFVKEPSIAKIKVKHHRCITRVWTINTAHEVVFVNAKVLNGTKSIKKPIYIIQNGNHSKSNLTSTILVNVPKRLISGNYNYINIYVCRGDVRSKTIYLEILKKKGERYSHLSDVKIKLNKENRCYDLTIPVYVKGTCKNENAKVIVYSKMFGKKELNVEIKGNKQFCKKPPICHCSCHTQIMKKDKKRILKKRNKNENKNDFKIKLICEDFLNSSTINAKLYLLNNDKPKNCTIKYYVFEKHEPLNFGGWKNKKSVFILPHQIKILNLSLKLKRHKGTAFFKVNVVCGNNTFQIMKKLKMNVSGKKLKNYENKTVKTVKKVNINEKNNKNREIKKTKTTRIQNKTNEYKITAEVIKKKSIAYRLFHLFIKWFHLHHKSII